MEAYSILQLQPRLCFSLMPLGKALTSLKHKDESSPDSQVISTHPQLVIMSWRALFNESTIICCNIPMMRVFLQHIYLQFDFFLFILQKKIKGVAFE